jgi:hypothetical protein
VKHRSACHNIAGRRHFGATRQKNLTRAKDLEKAEIAIWFALDGSHRAAL